MPEKLASGEQQAAFEAKRKPPPFTVYRGPEFVLSFQPLPQVVEGLLSRGTVVALTGRTGDGKTALATALELALATNQKFAGRTVDGGQVIVLCGENPEDFKARLLATMESDGLEPADLDDVYIIPSSFDIPVELLHLEALANSLPNLTMVVVDTSAAYFQSGDENDNVAMRAHAAGLRTLTTLKGKPVVVALCHPSKAASKDNLLPRGGGAFLAEIDANLTLWREASGVITLHWAGKLRGPNFDPITFKLEPWNLQRVKYPDGKRVPGVVARWVSDEEAEGLEQKQSADEDTLLRVMRDFPHGSMSEWAVKCGFTKGMGEPQKWRVQRLLVALEVAKLVVNERHQWRLTKSGKSAAGGFD